MAIHPERADRVEDPQVRGVDWDTLIRRAQRHRVLPLVYRSLSTLPATAVPSSVATRLEDAFHRVVRRNLYLTHQLCDILDGFADHGIPTIAYKGPVLAVQAYGHLGHRQFDDLDLLVPQDAIPQAKAILSDHGYQPRRDFSPGQEAAYLRYNCEHSYHRTRDGTTIDLHWRPIEPHFVFSPRVDQYWSRTETIIIGDREISTLSPEDLLLLLAVHGSKHLWHRLGWLCDVATLLKSHDIAWKSVHERTSDLGVKPMFQLGLVLAHDILGSDLPATVIEQCEAQPAVTRLADRVCDRLFRDDNPVISLQERTRFHSTGHRRRRDKLRYWWRLTTTPGPKDLELIALPQALIPVYRVLRPVRLFVEYGPHAVSHQLTG